MAVATELLYRNYDSSDATFYTAYSNELFPTIENVGWAAQAGHIFKEWNTSRDGTGASFDPGDSFPSPASYTTFYAIWEECDISISYKGSSIATMSASGTKTLETEGKYCEDDITITYTKPSAPTPTLQTKSATYTPSTSQQTASITADAGYDGLDEVNVTVNAMPSGSATTPATSITANPSISVSSSGLITASVSASQSVTPTVSAGYVSSGTAGTVSVSGSNTSQLTVYNGAHHHISVGYTVTVSLTNPRNSSEFEDWTISESPTDNPPTWTQIGTITSATGSETVTVTERYILVATTASYSASGTEAHSGGIIYIGWSEYPQEFTFEVTGNGTITIDNVNYDG